jgi:hypothetical protein
MRYYRNGAERKVLLETKSRLTPPDFVLISKNASAGAFSTYGISPVTGRH